MAQMIDAHRTGAAISRLRRARDWTQVELAERLHVTHQAVSRWETGDSFPDIAALHTLGQLFGVSVDELLAGHGQAPADARKPGATAAVVSELAQGNTRRVSEMVRDGRADLGSVAAVGPLVRPSHMEEVMRGVTENTEMTFDIDQVVALAPFVSGEVLQELAERLVADPIEAGNVVALAPFLPQSGVDALIGRIADGNLDVGHVVGLAPFASKETLEGLVTRAVEGGGPIPMGQMVALAPFLSRGALTRLVDHLQEDAANMDQLIGLAPFLDREALKRLVARVPTGRAGAHTLAALAPFLDQETLEGLIRQQFPTTATPAE